MAEKPLIAPEAAPSGTLGSGAIDSVATTVQAIGKGHWAEGLVGGVGAVSSVGALLSDPLAGLAAAGFGWLMEHVSFLKEPLDAVTGDQQAITAMATTWANISQEVQGAADDLSNAVNRDTGSWHGPAAEAYRSFAKEKASVYGGIATACTGAGVMVKMCGTVLSVVRDIIRDLISQAVGELVAAALEWAAAEVVSVGTATPGMVADIVRRAVKWAKKISEWTEKATKALKGAWSKLDELGKGVQQVKKLLEKVFASAPFGESTSIKRPKIGPDGLGTGNVHIDTATTAANKAAGKARTGAAQVVDGSYLEPTPKDDQNKLRQDYD